MVHSGNRGPAVACTPECEDDGLTPAEREAARELFAHAARVWPKGMVERLHRAFLAGTPLTPRDDALLAMMGATARAPRIEVHVPGALDCPECSLKRGDLTRCLRPGTPHPRRRLVEVLAACVPFGMRALRWADTMSAKPEPPPNTDPDIPTGIRERTDGLVEITWDDAPTGSPYRGPTPPEPDVFAEYNRELSKVRRRAAWLVRYAGGACFAGSTAWFVTALQPLSWRQGVAWGLWAFAQVSFGWGMAGLTARKP